MGQFEFSADVLCCDWSARVRKLMYASAATPLTFNAQPTLTPKKLQVLREKRKTIFAVTDFQFIPLFAVVVELVNALIIDVKNE